jgi:hypothetical protein
MVGDFIYIVDIDNRTAKRLSVHHSNLNRAPSSSSRGISNRIHETNMANLSHATPGSNNNEQHNHLPSHANAIRENNKRKPDRIRNKKK